MFNYITDCFKFVEEKVYEVYNFIRGKCISKYNRFRKLKRLVEVRHKGKPFKIFTTSVGMILQSYYMSILQYLNITIMKVDSKTFKLSYKINGKIYKMLIKPTRGPGPVEKVYNEKNDDLTLLLLSYMGPQYDFHGQEYTPETFEQNTLKFMMKTGKEITFTQNEVLKI